MVNERSHFKQYQLKTKTALIVVTIMIISSILSIIVLGNNDSVAFSPPVNLTTAIIPVAENISSVVVNKFSFNDPFIVPNYLANKQYLSNAIIYVLLIIIIGVIITSTFGFKGLAIFIGLLLLAHIGIQAI